MAVNLNELRKKVSEDKELAVKVIQHAKEELKGFSMEAPVPIDMQGTTLPAVKAHFDYKQQQNAGLYGVHRDLYFSRVDTETLFSNGSKERQRYLITKNRLPTWLTDDDWTVIAWTAPITGLVRDKRVGHKFEFAAPRRPSVKYRILESAKFGTILPSMTNSTYSMPDGDHFFADERKLSPVDKQKAELPAEEPELEYQSTANFGLGEIITLADASQYQAMQLPFASTVLIEGPPGSGKTSIGLMRIPCLIDQQWEELDLDRKKDAAFHSIGSVRVLVMNEEMIEYLGRLIRNPAIGLEGVGVQTLTEFCQKICRDSGVLSGRRTAKESTDLTAFKFHPATILAYADGFKAWVSECWSRESSLFDRQTAKLEAGSIKRVRDGIIRWVASVSNSKQPSITWDNAPNLSVQLDTLFRDEERRIEPAENPNRARSVREQQALEAARRVHDKAERNLRDLRTVTVGFVQGFFERRGIVEAMIKTSAFRDALKAFGSRPDVSKTDLTDEWLAQTHEDVQQLSEGDYALTAWLASHVAMIRQGKKKPAFGSLAPLLTHAVVDEAQDVALIHIGILRQLLGQSGTMTLVGDLRQRVNSRGYFEKWEDFQLPAARRAVFGLNYRQSKPLGDFLRAVHERLYGEPPLWKSSDRPGPAPRLAHLPGQRGLADAIAEEVRHWRETIPNSTVAVLYHGKWPASRQLRDDLETLLSDTLIDVHLAIGGARNDVLRKTDCAMVATVSGTKGLEFDVVVVIDPRRMWVNEPGKITETRRNALYVAASRAKQGLSIIFDRKSQLLESAAIEPLVERLEVEA